KKRRRAGRARSSGARRRPSLRSTSSSLELLSQLSQEPPVGALRNDLLRAGLDHSGFAQPQGIEAHRVLMVVFAPLAIGHFTHRLAGKVVAHCVALVDE